MSLNIFPGFTSVGVVSPDIAAAAVTFNSEAVNALQNIDRSLYAWADISTFEVKMSIGEGVIPINLTALLGFKSFAGGERKYHQLSVSAAKVNVSSFDLNMEWDIRLNESGNTVLKDAYALAGLPAMIINQAQAHKADMLAALLEAGLTNSALGMTARALTYRQPGYDAGLPLFSDGSATAAHFSNPLDSQSPTFVNQYYGAGQLTTPTVLAKCLTDMMLVPHPTKQNMTLGAQVTDIFGPTFMVPHFQKVLLQTLSLEGGAATSNVLTPEMLRQGQSLGLAGLAPFRCHVVPQLNNHPYVLANPGKQFWFTVSKNLPGTFFAATATPNGWNPRITLLGDGTEEAIKSKKIRMIGDLEAGVAAGMPHVIKCYTETTPGS
jgi:hypothetical protein